MDQINGMAQDLVIWFGKQTTGTPFERMRQIESMYQDWESVWSVKDDIMQAVLHILEDDFYNSRV